MKHHLLRVANPAGLIYGTIAVGALLASESTEGQTYGATVAGVCVALALYWLAYTYAEFVGARLKKSESFSPSGFFNALAGEITVVLGAGAPLVVVRSGLSGSELLVQTTLGAVLGVLLIVLRILLH